MRVQLVSGQDAPHGYRVPCGFLLVAVDAKGEPMYRPRTTHWIHGKADFFGLARAFDYPWEWDDHDNATAATRAALDFLTAHVGEIAEVEVESLRPGRLQGQDRKGPDPCTQVSRQPRRTYSKSAGRTSG